MEASRGDRANVERLERDDILHRKNAALLSGEEIGALRRAWAEIKDLSETVRSDRRGFFELAGQHGVPYWRCPHHVPERLFLPWHRAYLYRLEQALQDRVPGVTLPWWDWTTTREVPGPFAAAEVDGGENSLFSTRTLVSEADRREGRTVVDETFRQPGSSDRLPIPEQLADAPNQPNFVVFSDAVEELHDAVHG